MTPSRFLHSRPTLAWNQVAHHHLRQQQLQIVKLGVRAQSADLWATRSQEPPLHLWRQTGLQDGRAPEVVLTHGRRELPGPPRKSPCTPCNHDMRLYQPSLRLEVLHQPSLTPNTFLKCWGKPPPMLQHPRALRLRRCSNIARTASVRANSAEAHIEHCPSKALTTPLDQLFARHTLKRLRSHNHLRERVLLQLELDLHRSVFDMGTRVLCYIQSAAPHGAEHDRRRQTAT